MKKILTNQNLTLVLHVYLMFRLIKSLNEKGTTTVKLILHHSTHKIQTSYLNLHPNCHHWSFSLSYLAVVTTGKEWCFCPKTMISFQPFQ